jgi:hypothetical protein
VHQDSGLTARGEEYARLLPDVLESRLPAVGSIAGMLHDTAQSVFYHLASQWWAVDVSSSTHCSLLGGGKHSCWRIGGDSGLAARGEKYVRLLPDVLESRLPAVSG